MLARQLALALDEIAQTRRLHQQLERDLLQAECDVGTELLQGPQPPERVRLHGQLASIAAERRRHAMTRHEQLRSLHQRLLDLLNKQAFLAPDDED